MGVLVWATVGPLFHLWLFPQVFPFMTGAMPESSWIPEPLTALGIGLALVGTLGAFIGTRPWPESDEAYRLSNSVLLVLFLLSVGTTCIAGDLSFARMRRPEPDLLTPVLSFGATYIVVFFASSQTLLWGDLRRLHLKRRINAVTRMHTDLWRTFTQDSAAAHPANEIRAAVTSIGLWIAAPTVATLWAALVQELPAGIAAAAITAAILPTSLTVLVTRQLIIVLAETPTGRFMSPRIVAIPATAFMALQIAALGFVLAELLGGVPGMIWLSACIVHIVMYSLTAIIAITGHRGAMLLTGTLHVAVSRNARARETLMQQRERLVHELGQETRQVAVE